MEYKKVSIPINHTSGSSRNDTLHEMVKRYGRLARYNLASPSKMFYYIKGESMETYYRARDKWKQAFVNFASASEYRMFHKKMV